jgi:recombination protein RecA
MYSEGISKIGDVLDLAVNFNFVQKSGTWFSYNDLRLGQGRENTKRYLNENEKLLKEMESKVREKLGLPPLIARTEPEKEKEKEKDKEKKTAAAKS